MKGKFKDNFKIIEECNIIDDAFFQKVMEDIGASEELLQVILGDKSIEVLECIPQYSLRNIGNRSVVLDLFCKDASGRLFNVEAQMENNTDQQKRMRYNISNIDTKSTEKGIDYSELPDLYAIMISEFDIFKEGKTLYHIDRMLRERGSVENNGIHEIYVNAKGHDRSEVTDLMSFILDSNGFNPQFPRISARVQYFKHENGGKEEMGSLIAQLRAEGMEVGRAEGMEAGIAKGMEAGRAEGMEAGIAKGRAEGAAEVLRTLGISEKKYTRMLRRNAKSGK